MTPEPEEVAGVRARIGLYAGPAVFALLLLAPAPADLALPGWRAIAVGALMAIWWMTEAVPIPVTALLPLPLFPALGVAKIDDAAAPYANPIIFLFMGGFLLALGMQRWGLHRRLAINVLRRVGARPAHLVGGVMAATAFLSMWVSNTATAVMMLPIGISLAALLREGAEEERNFGGAMMLGIAYAASIGGFGTLIGTPPNALLAGFLRDTYGVEITFVRWMTVGVPLVVIVLPLCWLLLTRFTHRVGEREVPGGEALIAREMESLGRITPAEVRVAVIFGAAAVLWIAAPLLLTPWIPKGTLSDAGIAVGAAVLLFLVPSGVEKGEPLLRWDGATRLPWDVLVLFGGGLSLADAVADTGVSTWIGGRLQMLSAMPTPVLILCVTLAIVALSELASNTAVAAALLPVVGALAIALGENPLLLAVPAALAASAGFMLPVATPPNAIAYATGHVSVKSMARAGFWLDLICIGAILVVSYTVLLWSFGIESGVVPAWAR